MASGVQESFKELGKKQSASEIFKYLVIFSMVLASGANPLIRSIYILVVCCLIYLLYSFRLKEKYFLVAAILILYVWLDSCLLNSAATNYKECLLLSVRIVCCCIVTSNISIREFKKTFVNIMIVLAPISLFFFAVYLVAGELPGMVCLDGWVGTFYQTIGYGNTFEAVYRKRNCGIFTEPGVYQVYLNFALLALASDDTIPLKKAKRWFVILSITVISTFSSMGFLLYACVVAVIYIERRALLPFSFITNKRERIAVFLWITVLLVLAECLIGGIASFVTKTNSWASRHDDTVLTFLIAIDYPLFGVGLATDILPIWDRYYAAYERLRIYKAYQNAMSCGLGNYLAMGGIPFTILYLISIVESYFKIYNFKSVLAKVLVAFVLIMFVMEEPLLPTPIFLLSFFWYMKAE